MFIDFSLVLNNFHVLFFAYHCFVHWFSLFFLVFLFGFPFSFVSQRFLFGFPLIFFIVHSCFFSLFAFQCVFLILPGFSLVFIRFSLIFMCFSLLFICL